MLREFSEHLPERAGRRILGSHRRHSTRITRTHAALRLIAVIAATTGLVVLQSSSLVAQDQQTTSCPPMGQDTYQPTGEAITNIQIAINNLKDLENDKTVDAKEFATYQLVKQQLLGATRPNYIHKPFSLTLDLQSIRKLLEKNKREKTIRIVPGLRDGRRIGRTTQAVLKEGKGIKTEADSKAYDGAFPKEDSSIGSHYEASKVKPFGPHGFTCTEGTLVLNPTNNQWEKCPEGNILIDESVINMHVDLDKEDGIYNKTLFTSLLAHEKAHEYFIQEGDENNVPRFTGTDKNSNQGTISDAAHLVVFAFQESIVEAELKHFAKKLGGRLSTSWNFDAKKRQLLKLLNERSGSGTEFSPGGTAQRDDSDNCPNCGCPPPPTVAEGGLTPRQPVTVYTVIDRVNWCTFGPASPAAMPLTQVDDAGNPITPSFPVSDNSADAASGGTNLATFTDKTTSPGGIVIKGDEDWIWDPKENVLISKKDPDVKIPIPDTLKPGELWDPEGDPKGLSPIEPETSGNSRTYIDPKTKKIIARDFVDGDGHVYQRDRDFDQNGNPQSVRLYDHVTGDLAQRTTTDPKTGIVTKEDYDKSGKLINVATFKDGKQATNETYEDGKLVKRVTYWPGTDKVQKIEEDFDFDGGNPKKVTEFPLEDSPSPTVKTATGTPATPDGATADNTPQQPDQITAFDKTDYKGGQSGSALPSESVALLYPTPDLPGKGTKTAQDTGFDRDPVKCMTGSAGQCTMHVRPDDRPLYGLPNSGPEANNYRLDFNTMEHSGGIAETALKVTQAQLDSANAAGIQIAMTVFKIGDRAYTRMSFDQPAGQTTDLTEAYSRLLHATIYIDYCQRPKPAAVGKPDASDTGYGLPGATLRLGRSADAAGSK